LFLSYVSFLIIIAFIFSPNLLSCRFSIKNVRFLFKLNCLDFLLFLLLSNIITLLILSFINDDIILKINLLFVLRIDNKVIILKLLIIFIYLFVYHLFVYLLLCYGLFVCYLFLLNLTVRPSGKITDFSMCTFNDTIKDIFFDIISIRIEMSIKTMILKLFELLL
jgi:hypothetical protein